ncbi:NUDIX domain-containing protein [Streptacidiphilus sp. MAP5-52]|uniref:NUDIX domain-containing protein n=1 Tax=Streptacidiphilus sp. MAP5-52 TaxID=3156267 RepID=UPI0035134F48
MNARGQETGDYLGVGVYIVTADRRVLLNLRDDDERISFPAHWCAFGGLRDPGEHRPELTAVREVQEELGLDVDPQQLRPLHPEPCGVPRHDYPEHRAFWLPWIGRIEDLVLGEGQDLGLFTFEAVEHLRLAPHVAHYLRELACVLASTAGVGPADCAEEGRAAEDLWQTSGPRSEEGRCGTSAAPRAAAEHSAAGTEATK